jgi:hypothetical protein
MLMATFFAIFYIDDAYLASRDPDFLQWALDVLVNLFVQVGLEANAKKTQTMICTPGRIRTQLLMESYQRMKRGLVRAEERESRNVQCRQCEKSMAASSMRRHLADQHTIYQEAVVAEELLVASAVVTYQATAEFGGKIACPVPGCAGVLTSGWMLWQHFRDLHLLDRVLILKEGYFPRCERCAMQVNPAYPRHIQTKECQLGVERKTQREAAVCSALALRRQFTIHGDVLERVE